MNNNKGRKMQILEVGVEGGRTIFGEEFDGVWRYWHEVTSIGEDESCGSLREQIVLDNPTDAAIRKWIMGD